MSSASRISPASRAGVRLEPKSHESHLNVVICATRGSANDNIHIVGRTNASCPRIGNRKLRHLSTNEDYLGEHWLKPTGGPHDLVPVGTHWRRGHSIIRDETRRITRSPDPERIDQRE